MQNNLLHLYECMNAGQSFGLNGRQEYVVNKKATTSGDFFSYIFY